MPAQRTQRDPKPAAPLVSFFAPRTRASNQVPRSYGERIDENPQNPSIALHNPPTTHNATTREDEPPPGADDYADSEDDETITVQLPTPTFANITMTEAQKVEAILKWTEDFKKHTKKKKDKSSHVYYYMHRETLDGKFYAKEKDGPHIYQEFRWRCKECLKPGGTGLLEKKYDVLESNRKGVTSGMIKHLKQRHHITEQTHFARLQGYELSAAIGGGDYNELDAWSGKQMPRARLTKKQSVRRYFVQTRQPFLAVEDPSFQEMFLAHGAQCAYKNRITLRNHIYDDFIERRAKLKYALDINCISISFTLDMWTSPNRKPIFAIIGHWITPEFEEREEVLEFVEVTDKHTGEQLAEVVEALLAELKLKHKLFSITGDNAGNNGTLCESLFDSLKSDYDDEIGGVRPRMRFHGRDSWVRCLAHIINLICTDVLTDQKAGTAKDAKKLLDSWEKQFHCNDYKIPGDPSRSVIAKVRLVNLWVLRSTQREQDWAKLPNCTHRRPIYDVDTRWNSMYDMIKQFLDLLPEYKSFITSHRQISCLLPSTDEILALTQLAHVLKPFKMMTLKVSEEMPSLTRSLEIYWDLDDLLDRVINGDGDYNELDQSVRRSFKSGKAKHVVYMEKMEKAMMIFAAHILDPSCKASLIKDMMPDKFDRIITSLKRYFEAEWPETVFVTPASTSPPTPALLEVRPANTSVARWKQAQNKRAQDVVTGTTTLTSELERWLESETIDFVNTSRDAVRKWWKEHATEWPKLAAAARDLLAISASEVDVERLFSGCRDEVGMRRHSLKSDTIRVLTLLRSAYTTEDDVDKALIKAAMELDIVLHNNSILWRPDQIEGHLADGESLILITIHLSDPLLQQIPNTTRQQLLLILWILISLTLLLLRRDI